MSEIRTKEINETAWTGKSIDSKITNNLTSIKLNCKSLKEGIEEIKSYNGKRRTEGPAKTISLGLTENEKSVYPEGTRKQTEIYETWEFRGLNDKNISLTAKIISEIDLLKHLLSENSAQFSDLEISAENLGLEYNKILALASASGIDIGSILLHNTDATTKSGESGDRTLDEDYSRIDESNYYLYEGLEDGEYLYLEAGTGVEAGTFFIMKHTKDGREVHMKNISAATAEDWANKTLTKLGQDPNSSKKSNTRTNILNGLSSVGAGIIGIGNKIKRGIDNEINQNFDKKNQQSTSKNLTDEGFPSSRDSSSQPKPQSTSKNLTDEGFPSSRDSSSQPKPVEEQNAAIREYDELEDKYTSFGNTTEELSTKDQLSKTYDELDKTLGIDTSNMSLEERKKIINAKRAEIFGAPSPDIKDQGYYGSTEKLNNAKLTPKDESIKGIPVQTVNPTEQSKQSNDFYTVKYDANGTYSVINNMNNKNLVEGNQTNGDTINFLENGLEVIKVEQDGSKHRYIFNNPNK